MYSKPKSKVKKSKLNKNEDKDNELSIFKFIKSPKQTEKKYTEGPTNLLKRKRVSDANVFLNNQNGDIQILERSLDDLTPEMYVK